MSYASPKNADRRLIGFIAVIVLHIVMVYALLNGLARKIVEVVLPPLETRIIEEVKPPPPDRLLPLPPPKLAAPPPPYVPPPRSPGADRSDRANDHRSNKCEAVGTRAAAGGRRTRTGCRTRTRTAQSGEGGCGG